LFVPVYDPFLVYGVWPWPAYRPFYWYPPGFVAVGVFGWGAPLVVGAAIWSSYNWYSRRVDVDVVRFNRFNHTRLADSPENRAWRHDPAHRGSIAYSNPKLREEYGKTNANVNRGTNQQFLSKGGTGAGTGKGINAGTGAGPGKINAGTGGGTGKLNTDATGKHFPKNTNTGGGGGNNFNRNASINPGPKIGNNDHTGNKDHTGNNDHRGNNNSNGNSNRNFNRSAGNNFNPGRSAPLGGGHAPGPGGGGGGGGKGGGGGGEHKGKGH
jgi:hypothetical protein